MKSNIFTSVLTIFGIASAIAISPKPSQAQDRFSCNLEQVSTMVQTERGAIPLLRWTDRSFPPPYTPQQRCQIVSERFRKFNNNGTLKYIKADRINNLPVLCVAAYKGGSCLPNGLLVTFKPGTNADTALVKILDRRVWAAGEPYQLCSDCANKSERVISRFNGETYVNMELFLNLTSATP
ncbi:MAG: COP23 domain-containing protein [Cyanobacteria bacterium J06600_6]